MLGLSFSSKLNWDSYIIAIARLDNKNLKFFKRYSIIALFKALNERISEWAYFFRDIYILVLQNRGLFQTRIKGELHT